MILSLGREDDNLDGNSSTLLSSFNGTSSDSKGEGSGSFNIVGA